ncbi:unnamed protein product [Rangifer tarandus platyrhynchus]|uniref:Uncharacterized protein n=1 Tax=Rangifer tarandus platyrhynchus TaxID=3082113 RepID=A0ABN8YVP7_RANTA|nr:unnamed protein product [Rangifer tarandus platyrhynchus]
MIKITPGSKTTGIVAGPATPDWPSAARRGSRRIRGGARSPRPAALRGQTLDPDAVSPARVPGGEVQGRTPGQRPAAAPLTCPPAPCAPAGSAGLGAERRNCQRSGRKEYGGERRRPEGGELRFLSCDPLPSTLSQPCPAWREPVGGRSPPGTWSLGPRISLHH